MTRKGPTQPDRREIAADLFRDHLDLGRIEKAVSKAKQAEEPVDRPEPASNRPPVTEMGLQSVRAGSTKSEKTKA